MAASSTKPLTRARLSQALRRSVSPELAEVLVPAVRWRIEGRAATAVFASPIWHEVYHEHVAKALAEYLAEQHIQLDSLVADHESNAELPTERTLHLDDLMVDPGNEFALSAARQVVEAPGVAHNPLYVHGPAGSGKTAILLALANEFRELTTADQVVVIRGNTWVARQAQELADNAACPLAQQLDQAVLIAFDDVDLLATRTLAQEQLFLLINRALDNGQQLVLSGNQAPRGLESLEERLLTRLSWGLVIGLDQPLLETRIAVVRQIAGTAIADRSASELTSLVEALAPDLHQAVRLAERLARGERIDLGQEQTSFDRVLDCVARHYGIRPGDIAGKRRHRVVAQARQTALMLARRLTGHSLEALGGMVGGRDHSTVLYGIRQAEERLSTDNDYRREIAELTQEALSDGNPAPRRS